MDTVERTPTLCHVSDIPPSLAPCCDMSHSVLLGQHCQSKHSQTPKGQSFSDPRHAPSQRFHYGDTFATWVMITD